MAKESKRQWLLRADRGRPRFQEPTKGALVDRLDYRPIFPAPAFATLGLYLFVGAQKWKPIIIDSCLGGACWSDNALLSNFSVFF